MAPEIRITVDGPTLDEWRRAVVGLRRWYSIPITVMSRIPGAPPAPRALFITGERFLLDVGAACSRPEILDDPSRFFAIFRYARALSDAHQPLTLAEEYYRLDTHKKKVLSDEFGCGMAFAVSREWLGVRELLDLETAVAYGWVQTPAPKSRRPDYIGRMSAGRLIVLEAKGNQTGDQYAVQRQVPDGCEQVRAVRVGPGRRRIQVRLVVATSLSFEHWGPNTRIHVGDPEEENPEDYLFTEEIESLSARLHYLRVAAFVGDVHLASKMARRELRWAGFPARERPVEGRTYIGSELIMEAAEERVGVFVGLERGLRDQLLAEDMETVLHRDPDIPSGARIVFREMEPPAADREALLEMGETIATAPDGTVWMTWLERR